MNKPKRGEFWRNPAGRIHTIICTANHYLTHQEFVIYQNVGDTKIVRTAEPVDLFVDRFTREEGVLA